MGNEQSCCKDGVNDEEIQEMKNSVKYARKIVNHLKTEEQLIAKLKSQQKIKNKNIFSSMSLNSYHAQENLNQCSSDEIIQDRQRTQKLNSQQQKLTMIQLMQLKQTKTISHKKQISFQYSPLVKKLIHQLRPFEKQFNQLDQNTVKIIEIKSQNIKEGQLNQQDIYKGQLDYFQRPCGFGVLIKPNANVLIANFVDGRPQGIAFYIFKNGSYYKGKIVQDQANDTQGEYHSHDLTYIGSFQHNKFHGYGKQLCDQYFFEGHYENNFKKHGLLRWNHKQNKNKSQKIHECLPLLIDFNKLPEFKLEYEGDFDENQKFTGRGRLKDKLGQYFGEFVEGKKHGSGEYKYTNGLKYVGQYRDGKKQGYGKLFNSDNTLAYEGNWNEDLPDGKGCSYDFKGKKYSSEFVRGISKIIAPEFD